MTDNVLVLPVPKEVSKRMAEVSKRPTGSGGGGNGGDTEGRIDRLELQFDRVDERLRALEITSATLNERVAHLPSKGFIISSLMAMLLLIAALIAFAEKLQALAS